MDKDEKYMRRALSLAKKGEGRVSPNPMVGAVIVVDDRIIGEGYHDTYGGPHAEVNAIASVREEDKPLLKKATIYVTLEPCAHFGKTPPCASLIVEKQLSRVVIGCLDPNPLVAGKGKKILEDAGIIVDCGILEKECVEINKRFMTSQLFHRPWIILKWAETADGFMAGYNEKGNLSGISISNSLSKVWMHRERSNCDAIAVGSNTKAIDNPSLNNRYWGGKSPKIVSFNRHEDLEEQLIKLRKEGITSLMIEGGPTILSSFLEKGLFDEIRIEKGSKIIGEGLKAPMLPDGLKKVKNEKCRQNEINVFIS